MIWWLSFSDLNKPEGKQFLGVAIVRGTDMVEAAKAAHAHGCNPGGEVAGVSAAPGIEACLQESDLNRLLSRAEAEELDVRLGDSKRNREGTLAAYKRGFR